MKSLRFAAITMRALLLAAGAVVGLAQGAQAACPSSTLTIPFQTGAVTAGTGTLTDSAGQPWTYSTPAVPAGTSFGVPVTLTPAACVAGGFVTNAALGTLRNNWPSPVGFYMLVPATITVTDLGRWVVSGNTGSHAVAIYDTTCRVLGTATVNTSGAPSGAFTFASLSTPITLAAGQHYYVLSAETSGGDQWYDSNATLTTTTAASVVDAAYIQGTTCNVGSDTTPGGAGHTYGFPSFKYH